MRQRKSIANGITVVLLLLGALIMLAPFLYMVSTAFKSHTYVLELPPQFIPREPTASNFVRAWESENFRQYFLNSLLVTAGTTVLAVAISSMMAFAFARFEFPGKSFFFWTLMTALMIPGMLLLIPQFILAKQLHLLNSLWGLIPFYTSGNLAFNTFLLKGYFEGLPKELEDSAHIDGASLFTIYARIFMPLAKAPLAVVTIFTSLMAWDEFVLALTFLNDPSKRTLPIAIALFQGQHMTEWGLVFAASTIAVVPVIGVFIAFQRYFIQGISTTGVK